MDLQGESANSLKRVSELTPQTSSQLKNLRDMGYVYSEAIGRESYYELREPLMCFCMDVRYRETKSDRRVLLELPIEERNLLKPLLDLSEETQ